MNDTAPASAAGTHGRSTIKAVAFDWGGTVMEDPGTRSGPMAEWPSVNAVEGIAGALDRLASHYLLAIATNAEDSGAELVRRALRRVGLADRFPVVIASCEIGHRKPERAFFAALACALRCRPEEIVMVGDDYGHDVAGAHLAGLRSVWFDRTGDREPPLPAVHDGRIAAMHELPAVIASLDVRR